ncbi:AAA family ATPase [Klenkia terrae]
MSEGRATIADVPQWVEGALVGRAGELSRLTASVDRAREGRPSAVLVAGDAGVGKSRLLTEVARHAGACGVRVLTGHCLDLGDVGLPYLPFVDLLRPLREEPPAAARRPAVAPLLAAPGAAARPEGADDRLQLFEGVAGLLGELAAEQPLLLVLEDLHWADRSSRDLLRYLLARLVDEPVALLASYRSDDLHRRHPLRPLLAELARLPGVERLDLAPLPDAEMADLVRAVAAGDGGVAEGVVADVVSRAEGNAFYAEELLAAGVRGGALPLGLTEVLLTRVEELGEAAQQVLRVAAVAGRRVPHALLAAVAGLDGPALDAAVGETVSRHLLVVDPDGRYRFRHALLREAVLADLLPGERTRLHAAVAARLRADGTGTAAELAHHARGATTCRPPSPPRCRPPTRPPRSARRPRRCSSWRARSPSGPRCPASTPRSPTARSACCCVPPPRPARRGSCTAGPRCCGPPGTWWPAAPTPRSPPGCTTGWPSCCSAWTTSPARSRPPSGPSSWPPSSPWGPTGSGRWPPGPAPRGPQAGRTTSASRPPGRRWRAPRLWAWRTRGRTPSSRWPG